MFSKSKILRTTEEAEAFRVLHRENVELFKKVEESAELQRFRELEEYIADPLFKQRKKEVERLSYKGSRYHEAEKQYKALLKSRKLQSYHIVHNSPELMGYEKVKDTDEYREYTTLLTVVKSAGFDKKIHAVEYKAYREIIRNPKIAALIKFEKLKRFREYREMKDSDIPAKFDELSAFVQSAEFKEQRKFLLSKHRYTLTEDYQKLMEYENLKRAPEIVKYKTLLNDPYFSRMHKWELVFEDDFERGALDAMKWITRYYAGERFLNDTYGVGGDVQLFTADNVSFGQSSVSLNFRKESIIGKYWDPKLGIREHAYEYTSGLISTAVSFRQRYGRFEAKIRLNRSDVAACFWLAGDKDVPHVNVMKCTTEGVSVGCAYANRGGVSDTTSPIKELGLLNDYYIFTLEWTEEHLMWMVNDLVVKEVKEHVPDIPMYVVFSLGTTREPERNASARMEIDWVRAYSLKG